LQWTVRLHLPAGSYSLHTKQIIVSVYVSNLFRHLLTLRKHKTCMCNQSPTSVGRGVTDHIGVSSLQFCSLNNFLSARRHSSASSPHACCTRVTQGVGHHYCGTCESISCASWPPTRLVKVDTSLFFSSTGPQNASKCRTLTQTCACNQPSSNNRQF
jgi:hypothetical protein